jgi:hypothetical protein
LKIDVDLECLKEKVKDLELTDYDLFIDKFDELQEQKRALLKKQNLLLEAISVLEINSNNNYRLDNLQEKRLNFIEKQLNSESEELICSQLFEE